jgi:hypothetical protein
MSKYWKLEQKVSMAVFNVLELLDMPAELAIESAPIKLIIDRWSPGLMRAIAAPMMRTQKNRALRVANNLQSFLIMSMASANHLKGLIE